MEQFREIPSENSRRSSTFVVAAILLGGCGGIASALALIVVVHGVFGPDARLSAVYWLPTIILSALGGCFSGFATYFSAVQDPHKQRILECVIVGALCGGVMGGVAGFIGGMAAFALPEMFPQFAKRVDATMSIFTAFFLAPISAAVGGIIGGFTGLAMKYQHNRRSA